MTVFITFFISNSTHRAVPWVLLLLKKKENRRFRDILNGKLGGSDTLKA